MSIVLVGHPKLRNALRRPKMEEPDAERQSEIGDRTTVLDFSGLSDRQLGYINRVLTASLEEGVAPDDVLTNEAATLLAAKLKTPLRVGSHLARAFEAGIEIGAKPLDCASSHSSLRADTRRAGCDGLERGAAM